MGIVAILASVLTSVLLLLEVGLTHVYGDRRTTRHKRLRNVFIALAVISALVAPVLVWNQQRSDDAIIERLRDSEEAAKEREERANAREKEAQKDRKELSSEFSSLRASVDPILEIAKRRTPDLDDTAALAALARSVEQLQSEAEKEKQARIEIEQQLAPRRLRHDQKDRIVHHLVPFRGQRINFLAFDGDPEVIGVARDVLAALQSAGWTVSVSYGREFGLNVFGLGIEIQQDADETSKQAAKALVDALVQEGFSVESVPALPPGSSRGGFGNLKRDPMAKIKLIIGTKP